MTMTSFHEFDKNKTINAAEYNAFRLEAIAKLEGTEKGVYLDTAKTPIPSIGIGFNLTEPDVRLQVYKGLGIDPSDPNLSSQQQAQEQVYIEQLDNIITSFDPFVYDANGDGKLSNTEEDNAEKALQGQLDQKMANRAADPLLAGIADRSTFAFKSTTEMEAAFEELADGNVVDPNYEQQVDDFFPGIPPSEERVAHCPLPGTECSSKARALERLSNETTVLQPGTKFVTTPINSHTSKFSVRH